MKQYFLLFITLLLHTTIFAQITTGYYANTSGKNCADLKTALKTIISTGNTPKNYGDLWGEYLISDVKPRTIGTGSTNVIYDIYSAKPNGTDPYQFTPGSSVTVTGGQQDRGSGGNVEGEFYNREHSVPQSWFNGNTSVPGPTTDYHHIFPTDKKVNSTRANFIYGEVASASYTSLNGSKLGTSSFAGLSGTVFEPLDSFKGDVARAFLYFVTRYEDNMATYATNTEALQAFEPTTFPSIDIPYLKLMIRWHALDPVSAKEIARNNAGYTFQGNRNPYIDHPEYVTQVWNNTCPGLTLLPVDVVYFKGKLQADKVVLNWEVENEINFKEYVVERSNNGTYFTVIGTVAANGGKAYTFSDDANTSKGSRVYYRLKKVDKDGSFTYSDVFSLHIPLNVKFSVYPNPASNVIQLQFNSNSNAIVQVVIADLIGKTLLNKVFTANNGMIKISTDDLTNGTYLVKAIVAGEQYLQKVVVAK
jgi:endonuclease I